MKRLTLIFLWVFLGISFGLRAQMPDSLQVKEEFLDKVLMDTTIVDKGTISKKGRKPREDHFLYKMFKKDFPNPKKAMLLSFALPGTGQIYNRRWWKPPLVYGGMGWSIYNIVKNTNQYKIYRDAYINFQAGKPTGFEGQRFNNASDLKGRRDVLDKNRQLSFVAAILVYGVQGAEAFVDAHLRTFDVSDDLSLRMKLKPSLEMDELYGTAMGVGLSFRLEQRVDVPKF